MRIRAENESDLKSISSEELLNLILLTSYKIYY